VTIDNVQYIQKGDFSVTHPVPRGGITLLQDMAPTPGTYFAVYTMMPLCYL